MRERYSNMGIVQTDVGHGQMIVPSISPWTEMVCFETFLGLQGATESQLEAQFQRLESNLPSDVIMALKDEDLFGHQELESVERKVRSYLQQLNGFSIAVAGTHTFPSRLLEAPNSPRVFYYRGDLKLLDGHCVSVVGSRSASQIGIQTAASIAEGLVQAGFVVVSGLAKGIDTAAMEATIQAGGSTVGVIGTPLDQTYPPENELLQEQVACGHLLISQVPFYRYATEPFTARRRYFPARNATMAALSAATIIVEAGDTSGSLIQARTAMSMGRKLLIMDACFDNPRLSWPEKFLKQGAVRIQSVDDVIHALEKD